LKLPPQAHLNLVLCSTKIIYPDKIPYPVKGNICYNLLKIPDQNSGNTFGCKKPDRNFIAQLLLIFTLNYVSYEMEIT